MNQEITINILKGLFIGFVSICLFATTSCQTWDQRFVEGNLQNDIKLFEKDIGVINTMYNQKYVKFMSLPGNTVGFCNPLTESIYIDPVYYFTIKKIQQRALVYHEAGHCYCWAQHTSERLSDNCPKSIMHPGYISTKCLTLHWKSYIMDLKKRCE